jgi:hypothetical protein
MTEVERQPAHSRRAALVETAQRLETELGEPQLATLARIKTIDDQLRRRENRRTSARRLHAPPEMLEAIGPRPERPLELQRWCRQVTAFDLSKTRARRRGPERQRRLPTWRGQGAGNATAPIWRQLAWLLATAPGWLPATLRSDAPRGTAHEEPCASPLAGCCWPAALPQSRGIPRRPARVAEVERALRGGQHVGGVKQPLVYVGIEDAHGLERQDVHGGDLNSAHIEGGASNVAEATTVAQRGHIPVDAAVDRRLQAA